MPTRGPVVIPYDRVRTKSGRMGVIKNVTHGDTAHIVWDDGEEFPLKACHLEVLAHACMLPSWYYSKTKPNPTTEQ